MLLKKLFLDIIAKDKRAKRHNAMSEFEKKKIDEAFSNFAKRNFERPKKCKNLEQIRFYVRELSSEVDTFKRRFNYVPNAAYALLAQYNALQNSMIFADFKNSY